MYIFRYMSGKVYQGSWADKISGELVKYYGTERKQLKAPSINNNCLKHNSFRNSKKGFMLDNAAHWH